MRYIVGFILLVILIIFGFTVIFRGPSKQVVKPISLPDYANTSTVVQYTDDGRINADQIHRAIRVTVGRDSNTISILQGYQGSVLTSKIYPNNQQAYNVFLHALTLEGFTKKLKPAVTDNTGICPEGDRYNFQIISDGQDIQNLWTATCLTGSYGGNLLKTQQLFKDQIPDYNQITSNVNLNAGN